MSSKLTSWLVLFLSADHLRSQGSVRTLQFILFLYIQQIHKISFKASLVLGGEEYPDYNNLLFIEMILDLKEKVC